LSSHRCSGVKQKGEPCGRIVGTSFSYCYSHDPARLEERRRNASKAGKGNSQRELKRLKDKLQRVLDDVLEGRIDSSRAAVAANVSNALSRVYSVSFKAKELEQFEERLEELEASLERQNRDSSARSYYGT
jgi:hypothetical protein